MNSEIRRALKALSDAKLLIPESLSEQVKRLSDLPSARNLAALQESSAVAQAKRQLDELQKSPVPPMPYLEPVRLPRISDFEEANHFQSAGVMLRRLADSILANDSLRNDAARCNCTSEWRDTNRSRITRQRELSRHSCGGQARWS